MKASFGGVSPLRHDLHTAPLALRLPEPEGQRQQVLFPRMWADGIAKQRLIRALLQPVGAPILFVRPAYGQISGRVQLVIDDGKARRLSWVQPPDSPACAGLQAVPEDVGLR